MAEVDPARDLKYKLKEIYDLSFEVDEINADMKRKKQAVMAILAVNPEVAKHKFGFGDKVISYKQNKPSVALVDVEKMVKSQYPELDPKKFMADLRRQVATKNSSTCLSITKMKR